MTLSFSSENFFGLPFYQFIFFLLFPLIVAFGIKYASDLNVVILAIFAFLLPKIIFHLALQFEIPPFISILGTLNKAQYIFFTYALVMGGIAGWLIDKKNLKNLFSFSSIINYFKSWDSVTKKIEKIVFILTTLLALLKTLSDIF